MNNITSRQRILIIIGAVLVISLIFFGVSAVLSGGSGTVQFQYNIPDTSEVVVSTGTVSQTNPKSLSLHAGNYTLTLKDAGFKDIQTNITVNSGQTTVVNAVFQLSSDPTITSPSQLSGLDNSVSPTIAGVNYFYDKLWAVVKVQIAGGDTALVVAQYIPGAQVWQIVLGPGTLFDASSVSSLPPQVKDYMTTNYVNPGGYLQ